MKNKKLIIGATVVCALAVTACVSNMKNTDRKVAADMMFGDQSWAREFTSDDIAGLASSSNLKLADGRVIIDNDESFDSKLQMIQRAQKSIRMVYFIYANDDSSSLITQALMDKAAAGVKVSLLVDFITNYSKLDLFQMMVDSGKGNLSVHFYNFPSARIISDAKYMTLPCPDDLAAKKDPKLCANFKAPLMKAIESYETTSFSKMFLTGLYGKNGTALKVALGYGGAIDPVKYKEKIKAISKDDASHIAAYFNLIRKALDGDLAAKLELSASSANEDEVINPVMNELTGRFPIMSTTVDASGVSHAEEWDHFTDYTHHKLLAVDGKEFQLGGRNIEDSYHMKSRVAAEPGQKDKGKYIFMDTDFYGKAANGSSISEIEKSFDKLFNFSSMVADISVVQRVMPNDMSKNDQALKMATGSCLQQVGAGKVQVSQLGTCIETTMPSMPGYKNTAARMVDAKENQALSLKRYARYKKIPTDNWRNQPFTNGVDHLSASDLANAEFYYLENISYDKSASSDLRRRAGSRIGSEERFNKNIHAAWYRGLENACLVSSEQKRDQRVILHTAYLFMPSGLVHKLSKMMNGDFGDCSRVHITLLTNSFATTDLNVINVFARYQLSEIFKHYNGLLQYEKQFNEQNKGITTYGRRFPTLDYAEYKPIAGLGLSLHTKLSVIGDDVIIGSANADVRSYYMDSNNAILIRNAKDFQKNYVAYVDGLLKNQSRTQDDTAKYIGITPEQFKAENQYILNMMLQHWNKKITPKQQAIILNHLDAIAAKITDATNRLMKFRGDFDELRSGSGNYKSIGNLDKELNTLANDFDNVFKVL